MALRKTIHKLRSGKIDRDRLLRFLKAILTQLKPAVIGLRVIVVEAVLRQAYLPGDEILPHITASHDRADLL